MILNKTMNNMIKAEFVFPEHLKEFEQRLHGLIEEALNQEITDGVTLNGEHFQTKGTVSNLKFKDSLGKDIPLGNVAAYIYQITKEDIVKISYVAPAPNIEGSLDLTIHNESGSTYEFISLGFLTNKYEYDPVTETLRFTEKLSYWKITK